mmetsp:Transcript_593/g.1121  ORF Transcript_593/g.1121 Transcript_593/m.1121 type:complete len:103 (+) Transcript_593:139-447(+)
MAPMIGKVASKEIPYEIRTSTMPPEVQEVAVDCILEGLVNGKVEKDIATMIKRGMDSTESGGTWHCIVGQDFGASLCFDNKYLMFLVAQDKHVLLFRSFDQI